MAIFSCRAECEFDIQRFLQICVERRILIVNPITTTAPGFETWPDRNFEFSSEAGLMEFQDVLRTIADAHIMLQTLRQCPLSLNSLERDHSLGLCYRRPPPPTSH